MNPPLALPAEIDADGLGVVRIGRDPWEPRLDAYFRALRAGDVGEAERVASQACRDGESLAAVYERLMMPALYRVGDLWASGEMSVADEHLASEGTLRAMASAFADSEASRLGAGCRRCVLTVAAAGERHGIGVKMAADVLELAGHEVINCGIDAPTEDLIALASSVGADAIAMSFTTAGSGELLGPIAERIWETLPGLPLLVGGQGVPAHLPEGPATEIAGLDALRAAVDALPPRIAHPRLVQRPANPLAGPRRRPADAAPTPPAPAKDVTAHLTAIFETSEDAIVTLAADGSVIDWNGAAEALYGHSAAEAVGCHIATLIGPEEQARAMRRRLRETLAGKTVEASYLRVSPEHGGEQRVLVRLLPVREVDEVIGAGFVARVETSSLRLVADDAGAARHHLWHKRIEHALATDSFVLAAQPIIDLATDEVDHCELLLRMRMGGQIVMPGDFIPSAERSGQIRAIDAWVVEHGIEIAHQHPVALNLSGASLSDRSLIGVIESTLGRVGVDPGRVTFEITETAAAKNIDEAAALVARPARAGLPGRAR